MHASNSCGPVHEIMLHNIPRIQERLLCATVILDYWSKGSKAAAMHTVHLLFTAIPHHSLSVMLQSHALLYF